MSNKYLLSVNQERLSLGLMLLTQLLVGGFTPAPVSAQNLNSAPARNPVSPSVPIIPPGLLRPAPELPPQLPSKLPPPQNLLQPPAIPAPAPLPGEVSGTFRVQRFEVVGSTVFSRQTLAAATAQFTNKPLTFAELLQASVAITKLYTDKGYITSGAYIPADQTFPTQGGVVKIQVVEGRLEAIQVAGTRRLNPNYVRSRLAIATHKPLNVNRLLEALRLLQLNPLIKNLSAELAAGSRPGTSLLQVKVAEADTFSAQINLNNNREPSVGSFERQIQLNEANLLGLGDGLSVAYANTGGSNDVDASYTVPINPRNGTLQLNYANISSHVIESPFDRLDIRGTLQDFNLTLRQPIIQTPKRELALGVSANRRVSDIGFLQALTGERLGFPYPGANSKGLTRLAVLRFFQEYTQRNSRQVIAARSQFSVGVGAFDATPFNKTPPDSRFFVWRGQAQLVRLLAPDTLFLVRADAQLADRALIPIEQIGVGGQPTVRGYRQDLLLTDNAFLASAELRVPILRAPKLKGVLQIAPFIDLGTTSNNFGNPAPNPSTLASIGIGLQWQQSNRLTARFDYGIPLVPVASRKRNVARTGPLFHCYLYSIFLLKLGAVAQMPALILLTALSQIAPFSIPALPKDRTELVSHPTKRLAANEKSLSPALGLLQQGLQLYQAEKMLDAVKVLQQAGMAFQAQGDSLNQALALNYLSLAQQQLGQWPEATKAIAQSLMLSRTGAKRGNSHTHLSVLAKALNTQGQLQLTLGQSEKALTSWQEATTIYTEIGDSAGATMSKINQAQAFQTLGLYRRALMSLTQVNQTLQPQPDSLLKATGLLSLGNALRVVGNLDQQGTMLSQISALGSLQVLEQSLAIAKRVRLPEMVAEIQLSLGNTAQAQQKTAEALEFYRQAATLSASPVTQLQAQLNQLHLLVEVGQWSDAQALLPTIASNLATLPPNRETIYARINLAQSLIRLKQSNTNNTPSWLEISQLLVTTVHQSKSLGDQRAEANALGNLGGVYEQTQQWSIAQSLTQQALVLAQSINAPDIGYRWQWQLGRLLKAQGNIKGAIAAYTAAVTTLKSLRSDLVAINPEIQFSFRGEVEPVYRELVSLLLQSADNEPGQQNLSQARDVIESLQVAELENFFRRACLNAHPVQIDQVDRTAAVIYPVILADRLEIILSLPNQSSNHSLRDYKTYVTREQVESTLSQLRQKLVTRTSGEFLPISQEVYNWLIRPLESDLEKSKVKNLVFVLDGSLRNVPMAALHDGQHYLVEKYNIALTPGLQLLSPQPLVRERLRVLVAGITLPSQGFSALPGVEVELNEIKSQVQSRELLNQQFTSTALEYEVKSFGAPVVHLATHGQFSSKAEDTFLLAWNGRVNVNELHTLLQIREISKSGAIELLVLSACKTAAGDKDAALGLAGLAVRSGARSTLATLWVVNDQATSVLMGEFYKQLADTRVTKAEALRRAQLSLLKDPSFKHPYFWAPYALIGNWL